MARNQPRDAKQIVAFALLLLGLLFCVMGVLLLVDGVANAASGEAAALYLLIVGAVGLVLGVLLTVFWYLLSGAVLWTRAEDVQQSASVSADYDDSYEYASQPAPSRGFVMCKHCGTWIAGQLMTCPYCNSRITDKLGREAVISLVGASGECFATGALPAVIGRSTAADICIQGDTISREHARIVKMDNRYLIEDLNSMNMTFVNGEALTPGYQYTVGSGAVVGFGTEVFQLNLAE